MMNEEATSHVLMVVATQLEADSVVSPTKRRTSSTWPVSQGKAREMKGSCLSDVGRDEKVKSRLRGLFRSRLIRTRRLSLWARCRPPLCLIPVFPLCFLRPFSCLGLHCVSVSFPPHEFML